MKELSKIVAVAVAAVVVGEVASRISFTLLMKAIEKK